MVVQQIVGRATTGAGPLPQRLEQDPILFSTRQPAEPVPRQLHQLDGQLADRATLQLGLQRHPGHVRPQALALGEGGEQNAPLGRAVIGGLALATVTTLFFVPVMYSLLRNRPPRAEENL